MGRTGYPINHRSSLRNLLCAPSDCRGLALVSQPPLGHRPLLQPNENITHTSGFAYHLKGSETPPVTIQGPQTKNLQIVMPDYRLTFYWFPSNSTEGTGGDCGKMSTSASNFHNKGSEGWGYSQHMVREKRNQGKYFTLVTSYGGGKKKWRSLSIIPHTQMRSWTLITS